MSKPAKIRTEVSRDEFHALLHYVADQDAAQWVPGLQMFLRPDEAAFVEDFRKRAAQPACETFSPAGRETR